MERKRLAALGGDARHLGERAQRYVSQRHDGLGTARMNLVPQVVAASVDMRNLNRHVATRRAADGVGQRVVGRLEPRVREHIAQQVGGRTDERFAVHVFSTSGVGSDHEQRSGADAAEAIRERVLMERAGRTDHFAADTTCDGYLCSTNAPSAWSRAAPDE
jgi:hypothetical protein